MLAGTLNKNTSQAKQKGHTTDHSMADPGCEIDRSILRRVANGEDSALQELYTAYGQRMVAYALRLTGSPAVAEDVVQDTLVIVWRSAGKYRGEGRVLAWLLGILHHTAMKALRRTSQPISEEMENTLASAEPMPEEEVQAGEQTRWVRQGLQSLSPEHRAVLELVFYQGLSLSEAAEVCGCPLGTIKSRLSYARKSLLGNLSRLQNGLEEER